MNTNRILILTAFAFASGSALAAEVNPFPVQPQEISHTSRADVKTALGVARDRGELPTQVESNWPSFKQSTAARSRAEVQAEAIKNAVHRHVGASDSIN
ncbi:MAG: hypothetical protein M3N23_07410 [Pseudomonadota bacterium]|nr:hypothetical protein [Pseudomonadota bacterium]